MSKIEPNSAPFSYDGLDRVIHEKARLGLLTSLMAHPRGLAFADLKQLCGLTDGNLSRHLQVLQEAGLVEVTKGYEGNRPHTSCRLTKIGRRRFLDYLAVLERLGPHAARAAGKGDARTSKPGTLPSCSAAGIAFRTASPQQSGARKPPPRKAMSCICASRSTIQPAMRS